MSSSCSSNQLPPVQLSFASALASGQSITAPIAVKGRLSYELDAKIYPTNSAAVIYSLGGIQQNNTVFVPITRISS